jgi:DNA uptake protein ComE-like DNA-binding protein
MPQPFLFPRPKSGSILIISLWAFAVLSILSLSLAALVYQQIKFTNFLMRSTLSLPMARGALRCVYEERKADQTPEYDSLKELKEERVRNMCGGAAYKYYFVDKKDVDGKEEITDESSLINVNTASIDVLKRLPGIDGDQDLALAIATFSRRPIEVKEELLLIENMTKEKFSKFKELITTHGNGKININTASGEVLSALGLDDNLIQAITRYRQEYQGADGVSGTEDDGAFTSTANISSDLKRFTSLSLREEQDLISMMNMLEVKSRYLRFNVVPQVKSRDGVHYSIVIYPEGKKVLSWSEQ